MRDFEKKLHIKNHVLVQFTPQMRKFCVLRALLKSRILKKIKFKKHDLKEKIFSKKHDFE